MPSLFATSDLHVTHEGNGPLVDRVVPDGPDDWLLVAGDVGERAPVIRDTLATLRERFAKVVWVPGNHELWTTPKDECQLRGQARYEFLVEQCREIGVLTPEDEFPVWDHGPHPLTIAPLFVFYDYSWRTPAAEGKSREVALEQAREAGVVCTDEYFLHPDPYPSRAAWCEARLKVSRDRLDAIPASHRTILMSHWPLHRHPTAPLYYPEFALWCGTTETEDWHLRYRADLAVYGHLHIPRTTSADGVRFEEVSLGYPREWSRRARGAVPVRKLLSA
ncbi:metallophosphoesterase family protein [Amycolatopsis jiangsuensis]|uniref:3',5'-cyclic AMP phosphodiesterase CpdA n=1 Tax=Amycolatopsis jiangsuensis TaxID=1181879 RepID=A0A840IPZ8_9PSEU|nr:metallophosphoesterase [Amycolatopsis jiangsuensis]MBB4683629.1 3',5'-cyclic AMP phosphodiesterase CpdA [Amycolatopsis jiangsuensis]